MTLNEYQKLAETTADYKEKVLYPSIGLCGEAGEVADKCKKVMRDYNGVPDDEMKKHIALELGDTLWYCAMIMRDLDMDFEKVLEETPYNKGLKFDYENKCYLHVIELVQKASAAATIAYELKLYEAALKYDRHYLCNIVGYLSVCVYMIENISGFYGYTLDDIMTMNIEKLASRKQRGKIKGSGDDR